MVLNTIRTSSSVALLILGALLTGCATTGSNSSVDLTTQVDKSAEARKYGSSKSPHRSITGFSSSLRCMDSMFIEYGVRDVSVLLEDIEDKTKQVNAGTKDMLISAVSDMTRKSRAVRLIAFGNDSGNAIAFLDQAQSRLPYSVIPAYDIKGSISQFDDGIVQKDGGAGVSWFERFGVGIGAAASASVLGLDLTVLSTDDFSLIPGVTSRNSILLLDDGKNADAEAKIKKFGIFFNLQMGRSEGRAQALRSLVELASVELFGKLTRTPYWSCLGADADTVEIEQEVEDWYYQLRSEPEQLVGYFQNQLRLRGYYEGPSDGVFRPELTSAVSAYRTALGVSPSGDIDYVLYKAHLNSRGIKSRQIAVQPSSSPKASLDVSIVGGAKQLARDEVFSIEVNASDNSYLYCYLQDETRSIRRFFPNRFHKDSYLSAGSTLMIPGEMKFELVANKRGVDEKVACFASSSDLSQSLPAYATGTDFEALPIRNYQEIRRAFEKVTGNNFSEGYLNVDVK